MKFIIFCILLSCSGLIAQEPLPCEVGLTGIRPGTVEYCIPATTPLEEFGYAWELGFPFAKRSIGARLADAANIGSAELFLYPMNKDGLGQRLSITEMSKRFQVWISDDNVTFRQVRATPVIADMPEYRVIRFDNLNIRCRYIKFVCQRDSKWYYGAKNLQQMVRLYASPRENGDGDAVSLSPVSASTIRTDGFLPESFWRKAPFYSLKETIVPKAAVTGDLESKTTFSLATHGDFLFLTIECGKADLNMIKQTPRNSMDIFKTDRIEIFLSPDRDKQFIYHLAVNGAGSMTELFNDTPCTSIAKAVVKNSDSSTYRIELVIDRKKLKELAMVFLDASTSEYSPDLWFFNLCRDNPSMGDKGYSSYIYTGENGFANSDALGGLLLSDPAGIIKQMSIQSNFFWSNLSADKDLSASAKDSPQTADLKQQLRNLQQITTGKFQKVLSPSPVMVMQLRKELLASKLEAEKLLEALKFAEFRFPLEQQQRGYILYQPALLERPDPKRLPSNKELIDDLKLSLAGDESAYVRFSLFAGTPLKDILLTTSELNDGNGNKIPADALDLRIVRSWGPPEDADILATDQRIALEGFLENYAAAPRFLSEIPANTSSHFILQVRTVPGQKSGEYRGKITIANADKETFDLPVKVVVLPFELKRTDRDVGFFYTGCLFVPNGPAIGTYGAWRYNGLTSETAMFEEFSSLVRDGFNKLNLKAYAQGPIDPGYIQKILTIAARAGFRKVTIDGANEFPGITKGSSQNQQDQQDFKNACIKLRENLQKIAEVGRELGLDIYVFGFDEPRTEEMLKISQAIAEQARQAGLKTEIAVILEETGRRIADFDNVLILYSHNMSDPDLLQQVREGKTPYKRLGYYANCMGNQLATVRFAFGLHLYKNNFQGNMPWAYYDLQYDWDPFLERIPKRGASVAYYVFPTKDRPIPTLKYVASHEGLNDLRYLETLEEKITRCLDSALRESISKECNRLLNQFEFTNIGGSACRNFALAEKLSEAMRKELQNLIMRLTDESR